MKTKKLFLALFTLLTLAACSEQETTPLNAVDVSAVAENTWQESRLSKTFFENQKNVSHYNFSKKDILDALATPDLRNFRFVLGLEYDELRITMVGIDTEGKEIVSLRSAVYLDPGNYSKSIDKLENIPFVYSENRLQTPIVGKHLLPYHDTFTYVTKWKNLLATENIEEAITDGGVRYRYYSLEKEVIADMIASNRVQSIALFLGLNSQNELTTVFLQKDVNDALILYTNPFVQRDGSEGGDSYDFTNPCPNMCN
jgi:hypothetical protein